MTIAAKFKVKPVDELFDFVHCPDPNFAEWEWMEPMQVALSGRGVQQGRLRVTLTWELMSDGDYGNLMDLWAQSFNHGYRVEKIKVPTFAGGSNATYEEYEGAGTPGGYIRMMMPQGRRTVRHVENVAIIFEDIMEGD